MNKPQKSKRRRHGEKNLVKFGNYLYFLKKTRKQPKKFRPVVTKSEDSPFYLASVIPGLSTRCFKNNCDDK